MSTKWESFLARQRIDAEEIQEWHASTLPLRVRSYIMHEVPPIDSVSSVRGIVLKDSGVIQVTVEGGSVHLMPGGQCEVCETWEETFRREVLEETGWSLKDVRQVGIMHFHHRSAKPDGYRYPYPEFVHIICMAEAEEYRSNAKEVNGYELDARFVPLDDAWKLPLADSQRLFLRAAVELMQE